MEQEAQDRSADQRQAPKATTRETATTTTKPAVAPTTPPAANTEPNTNRQLAAFNICREFVSDRLKAPATAQFRTFRLHEANDEVEVSGPEPAFADLPPGEEFDPLASPEFYTVISTVDSENSFGALIRSEFVCRVRPVKRGWYLGDLQMTP